MHRRVLFTVLLAALGSAGAAYAGHLAGHAGPPAQSTTTTATVPGAAVHAMDGDSTAPATIVVFGHGWGHGVGMAQWGALGYAQHGWSSARILAHYYSGTTLERRPGGTIRVLLAEGVSSVTLGSESDWSVKDARGRKVKLEDGELTLGPKLVVDKRRLASPLTFVPGDDPLELADKPYRGRLVVYSAGGALQVVNAVKLEPYVKGVVGLEVPNDWPSASLQAQAIAARTFALSRREAPVGEHYDLYADQRSQVYGGIEAESSSVDEAVEATALRVLVYHGKIITAAYSSSSGGRTMSAAEAFGAAVPYLVSVPDPYDTLSPNHDWGPMLFDARKVGKALNVRGSLLDLRATDGPSKHVISVTAVGAGGEVTTTGAAVRTMLGLRSTWFTLGWLSLDAPASARFGVLAHLTGVARDAGPVTLEAQEPGGSWETIASVKPDANGRFEVGVRPLATTEYRLAAGDVRAGLVSLTVAPVVDVSVKAGAISGTVKPALPGTAVQLQRQKGGGWATVATVTPDTTGSFAVAKRVAPGSYRARWAPGHGLAPGVSRRLAVR